MSDEGPAGTDPIADYWARAARMIHWITKPVRACDEPPVGGAASTTRTGWFADGLLNGCFNALDRHVALGRADDTALIVDGPGSAGGVPYSYAELTEQTAKFAGILRALGVQHGDRVLVVGPSVVEVVIAMLAAARLGAVHCVVGLGPGFDPGGTFREPAGTVEYLRGCLAVVEPAVVVSVPEQTRRGRYVSHKSALDAAIRSAAPSPRHVVVRRPALTTDLGAADWGPDQPDDFDYGQLMRSAAIHPAECVAVTSSEPARAHLVNPASPRDGLFVRETGGHAVALRWSMSELFGLGPGDICYTAAALSSDLGQSFGVYAPLLAGLTSLISDGAGVAGLEDSDVAASERLAAKYDLAALITAVGPGRHDRQVPAALTGYPTLFLTGQGQPDQAATGPGAPELAGEVRTGWGVPGSGWPTRAAEAGLGVERPATRQEGA